MNGITESMSIGAQALNAYSVGMAVTAHNVANVNTAGFKPQTAVFATGPDGVGVQLETIFQGDGIARPLDMPDSLTSPALLHSEAVTRAAAANNADMNGLPPEIVSPSGTDLGREMVNMIIARYSFEANAATIRAADEMSGALLNITA
ncbi:MAG: flagellar basal body protein [Desulfovibrio sp.]|jgi:flagellar basal-body rod protein FlgC|nr:flagellar basal body protein [Desulfovibrio sp.]